ncbi:unnamed protein product [Amaranthus hypochondriacus]
MAAKSGISAVNPFIQTTIITENLLPAHSKSVTTTIFSLLESGQLTKAVSTLFASPFPFPFPLYGRLFQLCAKNNAIVETRKVESHLVTYFDPPPTFLLNRAIETYGKCGSLRDARELFDEMPNRDGGSWNALITASSQMGSMETLSLFLRMNRSGWFPSEVTFASILGSFGVVLGLCFTRVVHGFILKLGLSSNVILASALVDVYGKCDDIVDARRIFNEIDCPNYVSWNVIVRRYLEVGNDREAISMFFGSIQAGVKPLTFTFCTALIACSARRGFLEGVQIHGVVIKCKYESDAEIANSLIDMYMKCNDVASARKIFDKLGVKDICSWTCMVSGYAKVGRLKEAQALFDEMPERNIISWNAMLAGYVHLGQWEKALNFIFMMCQEINQMNAITYNLVLNVSAALSDIEFGKQVHACIYRHGFESDLFISNALIDMYGKCGGLRNAKICFHNITGRRDTISWNSLLTSLARHHLSEDVIYTFSKMLKETSPNEHTFAILLSTCANKLALKQGKEVHCFMIRNGYEIDDFALRSLLNMYSKCRHLE